MMYGKSFILILCFISSFHVLGFFHKVEGDVFNDKKKFAMDWLENYKLSIAVLDRRFVDQNNMISSELGFNIDNACMEELGFTLPFILKETVTEGIQCLLDLGQGSRKNLGSLKNIFKIIELLEGEDKVNLVCSESASDFRSTAIAHSSVSVESPKIHSSKIAPPYISLNPQDMPDHREDIMSKDLLDLKDLFFHELIHNVGYNHNTSDIEYAYACSECCFSKLGLQEKASACKICRGDYKDPFELDYLKDFIEYLNVSDYSILELGIDAIKEYTKREPRSIDGYILLIQSYGRQFYPIGYYLALKLEESQLNLSRENLTQIKQIRAYSKPGHTYAWVNLPSKEIADSFFEIYYNHNINKGLFGLEENKELIKVSIERILAEGIFDTVYLDIAKSIGTILNRHLWNIIIDKDLHRELPEIIDRTWKLREFFKDYLQE